MATDVLLKEPAIEFSAALEAASGTRMRRNYCDPMPPDAIFTAYDDVLMANRPDRGLDVLARTGVLQQTLPEVFALVGFGDAIRHKDVWAHTKQVICQTPARRAVRWGALFHDIGKVPTRRFTSDGQVTFLGHPEVGARMFDKIASRLPFPEKLRTEIRFLIAAHLRASAYSDDWTDSAVRRFAKDSGPCLADLLDLCRADITSKYEEKVRRGLRQINCLAERVEKILRLDARPKALPTGLGEALIRELNIVPGKTLGNLMKALTQVVDSGQLPRGAEYRVYIDHVRANPAILADSESKK